MVGKKLIPRHREFINQYFKCNMNATDAYQKTYPKSGYETARRNASTLLTRTDIKEAIQKRLKSMQMGADEVLARIAEQSSSAYSKYLQPNGTVDLESLLKDGKGHLVKSFKHTKEGLQVEFYGADKALNTMAKHHGLLTDKLDIKIEGELDKLLDTLESNLDTETYDRILNIITGSKT